MENPYGTIGQKLIWKPRCLNTASCRRKTGKAASEEDLRVLVWEVMETRWEDEEHTKAILREEAQEYQALAEVCVRVVLQALLTNDDEIIPDIDAVLYNLLVGGAFVSARSGHYSPISDSSKEVGKRMYEETLSLETMKKNDYKRLRELLDKVMGDPITRVGLFTPTFDGGSF